MQAWGEHRWPALPSSRWFWALGAAVVIAAVGVSSGCAASTTHREETAVETWARTDLGFGDGAACLAPYLTSLDLEGVTLRGLRSRGMWEVPLAARQQVADAVVVCGLEAHPR